MGKNIICLYCGKEKLIPENKVSRLYNGQKVVCLECEYELLYEIGNMTKENYRDFLDCKIYIDFDDVEDFEFFLDHLIKIDIRWYGGYKLNKSDEFFNDFDSGYRFGMNEGMALNGITKYGLEFLYEDDFIDDGYERFLFKATQ